MQPMRDGYLPGPHELLVLADQLLDQRVLPHDLTSEDGVQARDVGRLSRHHLGIKEIK